MLMHSNSEMRVTALGLSKWYYSSGGASRISLQEAFRYQWNRLCGRANRDLLLEESPLQRQGRIESVRPRQSGPTERTGRRPLASRRT